MEMLPVLFAFISIEWLQREEDHQFRLCEASPTLRLIAYASLLVAIVTLGRFVNPSEFIYFQF